MLRYERRKEIAADETVDSRTAQPFVLTATLVRYINRSKFWLLNQFCSHWLCLMKSFRTSVLVMVVACCLSGTSPQVNSLLLATRDEVFEYRDKYQNVFNR